jgi:hypothetical protein
MKRKHTKRTQTNEQDEWTSKQQRRRWKESSKTEKRVKSQNKFRNRGVLIIATIRLYELLRLGRQTIHRRQQGKKERAHARGRGTGKNEQEIVDGPIDHWPEVCVELIDMATTAV